MKMQDREAGWVSRCYLEDTGLREKSFQGENVGARELRGGCDPLNRLKLVKPQARKAMQKTGS